jgi:hypothetical protein
MNKVLVRHIHDINGKLVATVAAVDKNMIGVSIVSERDIGVKTMGALMAVGKAYTSTIETVPNRKVWVGDVNKGNVAYKHLADVIRDETYIMSNRAYKYFR